MIRILLPSGHLVETEHIAPLIEKVVEINGERRRLVEVARKFDKVSNALIIRVSARAYVNDDSMVRIIEDVVIGNLKPAKVKEIVREAVSQGYYDFTTLIYQDAKFVSNIVFDNGESLPYATDITIGSFPFTLHNYEYRVGTIPEALQSLVNDEDEFDEEEIEEEE